MGTAGQDRTRGTVAESMSPAATGGQNPDDMAAKMEEIELQHMKFNQFGPDSYQSSSGPVIGRDPGTFGKQAVKSGNKLGNYSNNGGVAVPRINLGNIKESPMKIDHSQTSPDNANQYEYEYHSADKGPGAAAIETSMQSYSRGIARHLGSGSKNH